MATNAADMLNGDIVNVLFLSDYVVPGHPFWEELTKAGFILHSSISGRIPDIQNGKLIVIADAIVDFIPDKWLSFLIENEKQLADIPRILLVMNNDCHVEEKKRLFQCDDALLIEPCDIDSIKECVNKLAIFAQRESAEKVEISGCRELSGRFLKEIYQYRNKIEIFRKIISLAPSIKEYDFTLNSILKQINKVFNVPISSIYIKQDDVVYTLVSEPVSKNVVQRQINELLREISDKGVILENAFEITWGRNLIIGDISQTYQEPKLLVFPLESKGDNLGYWAIPSSDEGCVLDDAFISMISQQITLLINYSWLYKKQGLTVRNNLHRLSAINEVCKLFADINSRDFGLQFLLILLEHVAADKGLLILMDKDESIQDFHSVGINREFVSFILKETENIPYRRVFNEDEVIRGEIYLPPVDGESESSKMYYFGTPLVGVQGKNGVVFVFFTNPPDEEEDFQAFYKTMAILAGTHFESIELYNQYMEKRIMEEQINIAREIQRSLLPSETPKLEHFWVSAESRPATQVGGDFYDFITLSSSRQVILIGDVSGKGIPASQLMSMTKSLLKFHLEHSGNLLETFYEVNNYLNRETPYEKFVTVQAIMIDEAKRKIEIANAGHEFLLVYRAERDDFEEYRIEGLPLGIISDINFEKIEIDYHSGDIFIMFTDGLPEAMTPERKLFGKEKIKDVAKKNKDLTAEEILNAFYEAQEKHAGGCSKHDDTTIIVLKAK